MMQDEFANKTVVVTGGTRGLGWAMAEKFSSLGARVWIIGTNQERAEKKAGELKAKTGQEVFGAGQDLSQSEGVTELFKKIQSQHGIDILVNNAGITRDNLLMRMKDAEFDDVIAANLKSVFLCSKACMRQMLKNRNGRIINLSSVVGVKGQAGQANYAASKAGIIGFTKSLAREVAERGITVNAVAPGFIESDMTNAMTEEQKSSILSQIPMKKMGSPIEVAALVCFLASDSAGYITGQVLGIDGGLGI